jgi:NADPH:quinone reductase-like Zn-dependent oxidoreductase
MKAIVQYKYGSPEDVLELQGIDMPQVTDDEVLVRVHAAAVAGDDWHLMQGLPYVARLATGLFKPKNRVPGRDVAGRVEAAGKNVTHFQPGDEVFGWCEGAFAEYVSVPKDALALKPANLTLEQAAVVPVSGFTALQAVRDEGQIQPGQKVLIIGASGGVGTFAVQIAKAFGAEVTGVCRTRNADLVRSIGADRVIDYTREDFTQSGQRYDLIVDMVGDRSLSDCRRVLSPTGTLVMVGGSGGRWLQGTDRWVRALLLSPFVRQRLRPLIHTDSKEDLATLKELIEAGKVTPVVSARYALSEVPEAIRHFEAGHAVGKVVITV